MGWSTRNGNYWQCGAFLTNAGLNTTHQKLNYRGKFRSDWAIQLMSSIAWKCWISNAYSWSSNVTSGNTVWKNSENDTNVSLASKSNFSVARGTANKTVTGHTWVKVSAVSSGTKSVSVNYTVPKMDGMVKIYNGSGWQNAVPYVYNGSGWQQAIPYVYNGSGWQICGA